MGIVLPTTPFMLLAAALFARSSPRFHRWLLTHPWFGPPIVDWQQYRGIRRQARRHAIIFILLTFSVSLAVVPLLWVKGLLVVIMVILLTWLIAPAGAGASCNGEVKSLSYCSDNAME